MCHLTDHAVQRTKERVGLPKRSAEKNAQKALENGIRHCETKGSLNRYITALYWKQETANNIRVYCNNVYIFNNQPCVECNQYAPVAQHGKWVSLVVKRENWKGVLHDFYQPYSCSICQNPNTFMGESAFCPHCGARMTEDIDEQKK